MNKPAVKRKKIISAHPYSRCLIQRPCTLKDIEGKPGHMVRNVRGRTERPVHFWSPIMYGAACLLYGAAISDSVVKQTYMDLPIHVQDCSDQAKIKEFKCLVIRAALIIAQRFL